MAQSLLATDGYKFSMAEAGWPLRTETFYYSHRKGGPQVLPIDVPAFLRSLLPTPADDDYRYLAAHSYEMGPGFKAAIVQTDALQIHALPRGAVFYDREPVFTVTGPSALVSWLEPLVLMLHYRIQVASHAGEVRVVTCDRQREIIRETLDAVGLPAPAMEVDSDGYYRRVLAAAKALVEVVKNPDRAFEVGMRSASCLRPRVQLRHPGAPDQAPEGPMIPDYYDPRQVGELVRVADAVLDTPATAAQDWAA